MLRILNIEELQCITMEIPSLIEMFEAKEPHFFISVKTWLYRLEKILEDNRLKACADIAILRGTLISVERGFLPEGINMARSKSHKKMMEVVAVETLKKANELVNNTIKGPLGQINEAERLIRQMVPILETKGMFNTAQNITNPTASIKELWMKILNDPDLVAVAFHIKGLLSSSDILILLDRVTSSRN